MFDVIIIGGGPAGLTAALYAKRGGLKTLVLESTVVGGQANLTSEIENYPGFLSISGFELTQKMYEQCKNIDVEFKTETVNKLKLDSEIKLVVTNKTAYECRSVILATGARPRKMGIAEEEKYIGLGVSYCSHCDGNFFRNKDVAVVGGGNTALTDALYLSNICNKVYLIHRRDKFRGNVILSEKLKDKDNVEFVLDNVPHKIIGNNTQVEGFEVKNKKTNYIQELKVSGIFVAVGIEPNSELVSDKLFVENNLVATDENMQTTLPLVYAVGDLRKKPLRQVITACAEGATAASDIIAKIS